MSRRHVLALFLSLIPFVLFAQSGSPFGSGVWSGNVTPTSASVVVRLLTPALKVRLHVSPNPTLTPAVFSSVGTTAAWRQS